MSNSIIHLLFFSKSSCTVGYKRTQRQQYLQGKKAMTLIKGFNQIFTTVLTMNLEVMAGLPKCRSKSRLQLLVRCRRNVILQNGSIILYAGLSAAIKETSSSCNPRGGKLQLVGGTDGPDPFAEWWKKCEKGQWTWTWLEAALEPLSLSSAQDGSEVDRGCLLLRWENNSVRKESGILFPFTLTILWCYNPLTWGRRRFHKLISGQFFALFVESTAFLS